jgi:predicted nucleotidyltransferase component of viral defense system
MGQTILTRNQQKILAAAHTPTITQNFYLTGGTALAEYYYQHRFSEDFDFFSSAEFNETDILPWIQQTAKQLRVQDIEYSSLEGQLNYFFHFPKEVVKVEFAYFPFEHLGTFTQDGDLNIASLDDMAANKLQAIITQTRARDYFDLYTICQDQQWQVQDLRQFYRLKFDVSINPENLAKHFAAVIDATDMPRFLGQVDWKKIEHNFLTLSKQILSSKLT